MTEKEYLKQLNKRLKPLKEQDKQAIIDFYKEMIADKKENGKSEEEAIGELEGADVVAERTLQEYGVDASRKRKLPPMSAATWVLLIVGSPLWFGLAVAAVCIAITAVCLAFGLGLGAVALTLGLSLGGIAMAVNGVIAIFTSVPDGLAFLGLGLVSAAVGGFAIIGLVKYAPIVWAKIKGLFGKKRRNKNENSN